MKTLSSVNSTSNGTMNIASSRAAVARNLSTVSKVFKKAVLLHFCRPLARNDSVRVVCKNIRTKTLNLITTDKLRATAKFF